jgi:integrase/recombinase XerD
MSNIQRYEPEQPRQLIRNAGDMSVADAANDDQVIALWLATKRNTKTVYQYQLSVRRLFEVTGRQICEMTLNDLLIFTDSLSSMRPATQAQRIASVKSLYSFCHKIGYVRVNVAALLRAPQSKDTLNERILTEEEVLRLTMAAWSPRDKALIRMLYRTAGRISEVVTITWADLVVKPEQGQVTLFGKGGKTRVVQIPLTLVSALQDIRDGAENSERIFPITRQRAWSIVKATAKRAGITDKLSPHWFRHSHATHSLDHGAPLKLVSSTLGHSSISITDRYLHNRPDESSGDFLKVG